MREVSSRGLGVLAALLLLLGLLAGIVNRELIDGGRFAASANAVRRDPAVAQQIGTAITRELVRQRPDLVALRPLVESAATQLVASPAFDGVVTTAVRDVHDTVLGSSPGGVVFRLADVGAVLTAVLSAVSPEAATQIPPGLQVTLAQVGRTRASDATIQAVRLSSTAAWALPLLALLALVGCWLLALDRWRGAARGGRAVAAAGAGVALVGALGAVVGATADQQTLRGAVVAAAWDQLRVGVWTVAAIFTAAGLVLMVATAPGATWPRITADAWTRVRHTVLRRPVSLSWQVARGLGFVVLAVALLLWPRPILEGVLTLGALGLGAFGLGEVASARGEASQHPDPERVSRSFRRPVLLVAGTVVVLVAAGSWQAAPVSRVVPVAGGTGCNGSVRLCDRRYDEVAFPAAHNAMSAADEPRWFLAEQPTGLVGALQAGVRVLLIDAWYGQATSRPDVVTTASRSLGGAVAAAKESFAPEVVASALRLRDSLLTAPVGPVRPYLCHGLCELGATQWEPVMKQVATWMTQHPREVVTFFIEDYVTPEDTAALFGEAGLLPFVHVQRTGQPWPTLRQMIDSGHRLVVQVENRGGGTTFPWLLQGFQYVQDTPYNNPTLADLTCRLNRGSPDHPLFLVNNWLASFSSLVSDARKVNAYAQLWPYLQRCQKERGHIPNYVAVNFYSEGDVFRVVDRLNGL